MTCYDYFIGDFSFRHHKIYILLPFGFHQIFLDFVDYEVRPSMAFFVSWYEYKFLKSFICSWLMPRNWSDFRRIFAIQPISNGKKTTQPCLPIVDDIIMWNKFLGLLTKCKMKSIHNRMNEIEFKSIFKVHYYFWLSWSAWRGSHTHLAEHLCWIFVLLKKLV